MYASPLESLEKFALLGGWALMGKIYRFCIKISNWLNQKMQKYPKIDKIFGFRSNRGQNFSSQNPKISGSKKKVQKKNANFAKNKKTPKNI